MAEFSLTVTPVSTLAGTTLTGTGLSVGTLTGTAVSLGVLSSGGGGTGSGSVTSVGTGGGLTGGPVTSSGTISHADTSTQANITATTNTYVDGLTFDTYGHVTGVSTVAGFDGNYSNLLGVPTTFAPSSHSLSSHSDVSTASPQPGQVLTWNNTGSTWEPQTVSGGGGVSENTDVTFSKLTVSDTTPEIDLVDTNVAANRGTWRITNHDSHGAFNLMAVDDVGTEKTAYSIGRVDGIPVSHTLYVYNSSTGAFEGNVTVDNNGNPLLSNYGSGTVTGTATYSLAVNASGNVIEEPLGGGRNIPQNTATGTVLLNINHAGDHISISSPTGTGVTVPANVFSVGDVVTIYNNSTSNLTITQGTNVTLRQAGTANTGDRTLAQYGVCSIMCVEDVTDADVFVIAGAGLS